jgi:hypothetical protein
MSPKSGNRFWDKDMLQSSAVIDLLKNLGRNGCISALIPLNTAPTRDSIERSARISRKDIRDRSF